MGPAHYWRRSTVETLPLARLHVHIYPNRSGSGILLCKNCVQDAKAEQQFGWFGGFATKTILLYIQDLKVQHIHTTDIQH